MSREEERRLFEEYANSTDEARKKEIFDKIIIANLKFAFKMASDKAKECDKSIDDLFSEAKIGLIEAANAANTPIISAMGAWNKLDPTAFEVADLYKTSVCPLAKVMRRECKKRGIKHLKVVYSKEEPITPLADPSTGSAEDGDGMPGAERKGTGRRSTPGSTAFVPSVAGLIIAGEVIKDLIK